jgi:hypothetical protein
MKKLIIHITLLFYSFQVAIARNQIFKCSPQMKRLFDSLLILVVNFQSDTRQNGQYSFTTDDISYTINSSFCFQIYCLK